MRILEQYFTHSRQWRDTMNHEKIKLAFAKYVAYQARREAGGMSDAHFKRVFAGAILKGLKAGYRITDLDCFQDDPRYTGNTEPHKKVA